MPDSASLTSNAQTATALLANHLLAMRQSPQPLEALTVAKQCLLDWFGVTLAARREPLVEILAERIRPNR